MSTDKLVWVDVETTGLNPEAHRLLEVGIVITTPELEQLHFDRWLVGSAPDLNTLDKVIVDMHGASGLFVDMANNPHKQDHAYVSANITAYLDRMGVERGVPMCGSSVHFDRAFLKEKLPSVEQYFGYRNIDVSSIKELVQRWRPDVIEGRPKPAAKHRALSDIYDTLEELAYYKAVCFDNAVEIA